MEQILLPSQLIPITIHRIVQERSYAAIIFQADSKKFVVYIESSAGHALQMYLIGEERSRPITYDLLLFIFQGAAISIKQVVISDVQESLYFAKLFLEQKIDDYCHILEIDARPSDCIILAAACKTPIYCTHHLLQKIIPVED